MKKLSRMGRSLCFADLTKAEQKELERLSKKWLKKLEPRRKAMEEASRITAEDLAVRINI